MTPAGRPPRSTSSSKKSISVRVTAEEHELLSKAAHPMYVSDWLRKLALAKVSEPAPPPIPSGAMHELASRLLNPVIASAPDDEKRDALVALRETMAGQLEHLVQSAQAEAEHNVFLQKANEDMWDLVYKFAAHVKHDPECGKHPCACSIAPIAGDLGTAMAMSKSRR